MLQIFTVKSFSFIQDHAGPIKTKNCSSHKHTCTPKSGEVELHTAPIDDAANMASNASQQFGMYPERFKKGGGLKTWQ